MLGRVEVDDERAVLRVDQMVRAGCADLAHLGRARRGRERDRLRAPVDFQHEAIGVREQSAAQRRQRRREERARVLIPELRDPRASQPDPVPPTVDRPRGSGDELERRLVALLARLAPRHEPVTLEQDRSCLRMVAEEEAMRRDMSKPGRW